MDKFGICTSRHIRTVSLVVTAVDDFTARVITGSNVRVWIDGAKPPVKKPEGWNVFLDLPEGEHTVHAEGGFYNKSSVVCRVAGGSFRSVKIRLTPGRNAPLAPDAACVEGRTEALARILLRPDDRALSYKLLSDVRPGDRCIGIYHPDGIDIEGKLFCICSERGQEYVRVYRAAPEGKSEYLLADALTQAHAKIGTLVFPVSESCADEKGGFFLPFKNVPGKPTAFVCRRESPDGAERAVQLAAGSRIKLEI